MSYSCPSDTLTYSITLFLVQPGLAFPSSEQVLWTIVQILLAFSMGYLYAEWVQKRKREREDLRSDWL